jgi:hypothetical protein
MKQTTLSVVLEVQPESAGKLSDLIEELRRREDAPPPENPEKYGRLKNGVRVLHFMSLTVFPGADYDPIFVIEANFDGPAGVFWGQLEATLAIELRAMLRCCKKPADEDGPLYVAVTQPDSRVPLAPYLEARTLRPSVFHHGNRGMDRERILNEGQLFLATRRVLAQSSPTLPNPYRAMTAEEIHANLRAALKPEFPWLGEPAPRRIPIREWIADLARLLIFLFLVLVCLSVPGAVVALLLPCLSALAVYVIFGAAVAVPLYRMRAPLEGLGAPTRSGGLTLSSLSTKSNLSSMGNPWTFILAIAALLAMYVAAISGIGTVLASPMTGKSMCELWWPTVRVVSLGLLSIALFMAPALVLWLRWLERRDAYHDAPPLDEGVMQEIAQREDRIAQNHMGSVVLVKPGILRTPLFRAGHLGLGLVLRVVATNGYLGSMRTIHFAHWAFVNNGSRLMFFSNFDHSWESYLDDFIEKAHGGLTLAWSSCVGFPPTRFLVLDGASHGRQFKTWARHSMAVSRFWFSAYKDYTVDQIERQNRIADGLRKTTLTTKEAAAWVRDL